MNSQNTIWPALDCDKGLAISLAAALGSHPAIAGYKLNRLIDSENFRKPGDPLLFEALTQSGKCLWADMKLHDIPATVAARVKAYANSGFFAYITVMAEGGRAMMEAAVEAAGDKMNVIAVTKLTSLSPAEIKELTGREPDQAVLFLANLAHKAGIRHLVCSGKELDILRDFSWAGDMEKIVPAISPAWSLGDQPDQKRTSTPKDAFLGGAAAVVIGRAIVKADNPLEALNLTVQEIEAIP